MEGARPVAAPRGTTLTALGWPQEAACACSRTTSTPRSPSVPTTSSSTAGPAAPRATGRLRRASCGAARRCSGDETLLVQSGKPVGVVPTHEWAPRVLIANSNLVGDWATWEEFRRLEALGLTMYGQMTAGSWIYIGTQGILQGTYETFAAVAEQALRRDARRARSRSPAGCGGMGGAQPLAVTMNGGVCLCVEVDPARLQRRVDAPLPRRVDGRLRRRRSRAREAAKRDEAALSRSAWSATPPTVFPELLRRGVAVDIVTDQTSAHDPLSYVPDGHRPRPTGTTTPRRSPRSSSTGPGQSMARHVRGDGRASCDARRRGLRLRQLHSRRGAARRVRARVRVPRVRARLHPPALLRGQGTVPLGGAVGRAEGHRAHRSGGARRCSPMNEPLATMDPQGPGAGRVPGAARPGSAGSATASATRPGVALQRPRAPRGEVSAPIVIGRDHLDCGSVASPYRETEAMLDGSDAIADWPLLNALVNTASGRDVGLDPPRRRRRHRALDPRRAGAASPTAPTIAARRSRPGAHATTRAWASFATSTPATRSPSGPPRSEASACRCASSDDHPGHPEYQGARRPTIPPSARGSSVDVHDAALVIDDERVLWVGANADAPAADETIDAQDAGGHPRLRRLTHPPGLRRRARRGVRGAHGRHAVRRRAGSAATVASTRAATVDELRHGAEKRLRALRHGGTTTVEIKSGYDVSPRRRSHDSSTSPTSSATK